MKLQIEQPEVSHEDKESKIFPDTNNQNIVITSHCLTTEFLIYSTDVSYKIYEPYVIIVGVVFSGLFVQILHLVCLS